MSGNLSDYEISSKTVAFIPARGGSKGLPRKNIRDMNGKPLIAWTIEAALNTENVDRVIVSTDDSEIADVSIKYGAEVPFIRPAEIANDHSTTEEAMLHCCKFLLDVGDLPDNFLLLQCTSPVRNKHTLGSAISYFEEKNYDSLLSVVRSHRFTWQNLQNPKANYEIKNRPRRQDLSNDQQEFLETGSFYITKFSKLLEEQNRLCGDIGMFETTDVESFEIDTLLDFEICSLILRNFVSE